MVREAPLKKTDAGLVPDGEGWFTEDFLILAGEALLIVEGEERALEQWDLVHCPPETRHMIVGAGERPCIVLAVGGRDPGV